MRTAFIALGASIVAVTFFVYGYVMLLKPPDFVDSYNTRLKNIRFPERLLINRSRKLNDAMVGTGLIVFGLMILIILAKILIAG